MRNGRGKGRVRRGRGRGRQWDGVGKGRNGMERKRNGQEGDTPWFLLTTPNMKSWKKNTALGHMTGVIGIGCCHVDWQAGE